MARTYDWFRSEVNGPGGFTFFRFDVYDGIAGETVDRIVGTAWVETIQAIPASGFPLLPVEITVQCFDGPWSTWESAHPGVPAESSYGYFHRERLQWHAEFHALETSKFIRYMAPLDACRIDNQTSRKLKVNGDGVEVAFFMNTGAGYSINPFTMSAFGQFNVLHSSP